VSIFIEVGSVEASLDSVSISLFFVDLWFFLVRSASVPFFVAIASIVLGGGSRGGHHRRHFYFSEGNFLNTTSSPKSSPKQ
jgi:hypothetical protein